MSFLWAQRICTIQLHCLGHFEILSPLCCLFQSTEIKWKTKVWLELLLGMNMWQDWELRCSHLSPSWDWNGGVELGWGGALGWALRGGEVLVATTVLRDGSGLVTQSPYLPHCHMCGEWEDVSRRAGDRVSPSYGMSHHEYLKIGKVKQNICHLRSFRDGILRIPAYLQKIRNPCKLYKVGVVIVLLSNVSYKKPSVTSGYPISWKVSYLSLTIRFLDTLAFDN